MIARFCYRWLAFFVRGDRLWSLLEHTGITVFVGPNGSGKSLCAVASRLGMLAGRTWECWEAMHAHHADYREHVQLDGCGLCPAPGLVSRLFRDHGDRLRLGVYEDHFCGRGFDLLCRNSTGERLVYSTVALIGDDGQDHPRYRPLIDYRQLLTIEHAEAIFDEVAGISDASDSSAIPVQVVQWLHTLRKADVRLAVTTPAYDRCSKPIRQVAQLVVDCRSFFPERSESGRLWRPRRMFILTAYDAFTFEHFTAGTKERLTAKGKAVLWRPGHEAERRYDTLGQVLQLGHVTEAGLCSNCGGARSRPKCACPTHLPDGAFEVVEEVSRSGTRTRTVVPVTECAAGQLAE